MRPQYSLLGSGGKSLLVIRFPPSMAATPSRCRAGRRIRRRRVGLDGTFASPRRALRSRSAGRRVTKLARLLIDRPATWYAAMIAIETIHACCEIASWFRSSGTLLSRQIGVLIAPR